MSAQAWRDISGHYEGLLPDFDTFFKAAPAFPVSAQASSHHLPAASTAQPPKPISGGGGNSSEDSP